MLEIGTGTGYNAALIAHIVGDQGSVVTIDVVPELTSRARASLAAAGYGGVTVVCGDGAAGVPDYAPYDRIIVTAGAWDLAPQWLTQLSPRRPDSAADLRPGHPAGGRGALSRPETTGPAGRPADAASSGWLAPPPARSRYWHSGRNPVCMPSRSTGPRRKRSSLYEALCGPVTAAARRFLHAASTAELADLDLWLTLTEPGLTRLNLMGRHEGLASLGPSTGASRGLMPLGGLARADGSDGLGVATLAPAARAAGREPIAIVIEGFGPGRRLNAFGGPPGPARLSPWHEADRATRRAAQLELGAYPARTPLAALGDASIVIDRPNARLTVRWGSGRSSARGPKGLDMDTDGIPDRAICAGPSRRLRCGCSASWVSLSTGYPRPASRAPGRR